MNVKYATVALIAVLFYEILLKTIHFLIPSVFTVSFFSSITSVLAVLSRIIILLFLYYFYQEEKSNRKIALILKILLFSFVCVYILKLSVLSKIIDYHVIVLSRHLFSFLNTVLFFIFIIIYKRECISEYKLLTRASVFVAIMFGIGIIKSLLALASYLRFVFSGYMTSFSPEFYHVVFLIFILTHLALLYFLFQYYKLKGPR